MPVTTISEENKQPEINKEALYLVDFARIESVESLVLIFACMGLSFSGYHPHFDTIKHLLDLENPITPNNPVPQQPKADALRLPKLKVVKDGK